MLEIYRLNSTSQRDSTTVRWDQSRNVVLEFGVRGGTQDATIAWSWSTLGMGAPTPPIVNLDQNGVLSVGVGPAPSGQDTVYDIQVRARESATTYADWTHKIIVQKEGFLATPSYFPGVEAPPITDPGLPYTLPLPGFGKSMASYNFSASPDSELPIQIKDGTTVAVTVPASELVQRTYSLAVSASGQVVTYDAEFNPIYQTMDDVIEFDLIIPAVELIERENAYIPDPRRLKARSWSLVTSAIDMILPSGLVAQSETERLDAGSSLLQGHAYWIFNTSAQDQPWLVPQ